MCPAPFENDCVVVVAEQADHLKDMKWIAMPSTSSQLRCTFFTCPLRAFAFRPKSTPSSDETKVLPLTWKGSRKFFREPLMKPISRKNLIQIVQKDVHGMR